MVHIWADKVMSRLEEIKAREKAATPKPWSVGKIEERNNYAVITKCPRSDSNLEEWPLLEIYGDNFGNNTQYDDAQFIANARSDVPWLVERLELANALLRDCLLRASIPPRVRHAVEVFRGSLTAEPNKDKEEVLSLEDLEEFRRGEPYLQFEDE